MTQPYRFPHGVTIELPFEAIGATLADLTGVTATAPLKRAPHGRGVPSADDPVVAQLTSVAREAAPGLGAGWTFTLSADAAAELEVGLYVTNAIVTWPAGAVQKSPLLWLQIEPAL